MNFKRGSLYLMGAWAAALIFGYLYNFWLTHRFSQAVYGDYQVVISILFWLEIVVINGMPYTIQKFLGSETAHSGDILKTAFRLQLLVAASLFLLAFAAAPFIARIFKANSYSFYLRLAFVDILFLGFFHLFTAYQNGVRHFGKQALLIMLYALGKLIVGVVLVFVWGNLNAALAANVAASIIGCLLGVLFLGRFPNAESYPAGPLIRFTMPSLGYLLLLNLLFSIDLWIVNFYLKSAVSGYYGLAGMLARAPYFLFIGVSITMLPTLSVGLSRGDLASVRHMFRQALQFLWLLMAPTGMLVTVFSRDIMAVLFKPEYAPAAPVLAVLVWGMIALSFLFLNTTILNADHQPGLSLLVVGGTVILDVILNMACIPRWGVAAAPLCTVAACTAGLGVSAILVFRRFRVAIPGRSFLKISVTAVIIAGLAWISHIRGPWIFAAIPACLALYTGLLILFGELSRRDLEEIFRDTAAGLPDLPLEDLS
ncbi:polysaccharide biosynthesis protein [bacterium]|nr:polysaccharide biosynthesis protein [bacterium]